MDSGDHEAVPRAAVRCRFDLISEVISADARSGYIETLMTPDPRRHLRIDREEQGTWYLDKYLNEAVRFEDVANGMGGLPIFASNRTVSSAVVYANERSSALENEIKTGTYTLPRQSGRPHTELANNSVKDVSFISLDICGSTAYRNRDPKGYDFAAKLLLRELGSTVGQFEGTILKSTGDGFIALIDLPSFTVLADSTADLCGTMLELLHSAINPAIASAGLAPLSVRIGADYGPVSVRDLTVPLTGFAYRDVSSDALNRAVKIEQSCVPDSIRLGSDLYRILHVQWLERCQKVQFDAGVVGIPDYEVFELT